MPFLQYRTFPENGKNVPIVVPDNQMQQFIAVCETHNEQLMYLNPDEINIAKGTPVRIIGGTFDGVEIMPELCDAEDMIGQMELQDGVHYLKILGRE